MRWYLSEVFSMNWSYLVCLMLLLVGSLVIGATTTVSKAETVKDVEMIAADDPGIVLPGFDYACADYSDGSSRIRGDVDKDGKITKADADLAADVMAQKRLLPKNICCLDVDDTASFGKVDVELIGQIANEAYSTAGTCKTPQLSAQISGSFYYCSPARSIRGDVTNDGKANMLDSLVLGRMAAGSITPPSNACCADVDDDTLISTVDSQIIYQYSIGLYSSAGTCKSPLVPQPTGSSYYYCGQNTLRGDIDADGNVTLKDFNIVTGMVDGKITPPQNWCCVDIDHYRSLGSGDADLISLIARGLYSTAGTCSAPREPVYRYSCNDYSNGSSRIRGDIDASGALTLADVSIIGDMASGILPAPSSLCCVDIDSDLRITNADSNLVANINLGLFSSAGTCANPTTPQSVPVCGNNVCEASESCSVCSNDCGVCSTGGGGGGGGGTLSSSIDVEDSTVELGQSVVFSVLCRTSSGCLIETDDRTIGEVNYSANTQTFSWRPAQIDTYDVDLLRKSSGFVLDSTTVRIVEASVENPVPDTNSNPIPDNNTPSVNPDQNTPSDTNESVDTNSSTGPTGFFGLGDSATSPLTLGLIFGFLLLVGLGYYLVLKK